MAAYVECCVLRNELKLFLFNPALPKYNAQLCKISDGYRFNYLRRYSFLSSTRPEDNKQKDENEPGKFRTLNVRGIPEEQRYVRRGKSKYLTTVLPPRYTKMAVDQDWPSVWPTAQTFKASVVPLPLRQGPKKRDAPVHKFGNTELMKIPNFLHLTPPAIKRHCDAIKHLCTPWPIELTSDEECEKHFPVSVSTNDYLHSGPSIREPKARIVTVQLKVPRLGLNAHAVDKFLRLIGDRYDIESRTVTLVIDRCPLKKQNYEYAMYLLTALYFESWKIEPWELEKEAEDAECYDWNKSRSKSEILNLLKRVNDSFTEENKGKKPVFLSKLPSKYGEEDISNLEEVVPYSEALTEIHNEGEGLEVLDKYKQSVIKLLNLTSSAANCS